jgi:hypothetical protein
VAQLLLGTFVVWQLVFLLAGNAAALLPEPARRVVGTAPWAWDFVTGQGQRWNLFAPQLPGRALFLVVEAHTSDHPPVRVSSPFEAPSEGGYFHGPGSGDRLFHVEKELLWPFIVFDTKEVAARSEEWRAYLDEQLRTRWQAYRGYLAWQRREYRRAHPGAVDPDEWILLARIYPPSVAGTCPAWDEIVEVPFVRWRPGALPLKGCLPLEVYDSGRWLWLPEKEAGG